MFYYRPTLEYAYTDIVGLREHVPLGIMREMHRWGAHAMVITVWLHMFRLHRAPGRTSRRSARGWSPTAYEPE